MTDKRLLYRNKQLISLIPLDAIPVAQRERLACIDFNLQFLGKISRKIIVEQFGITDSMAVRDLGVYRQLMSGNMDYCSQKRCHIRQKNYEPLFVFDSLEALGRLREKGSFSSLPFAVSLPSRFILPNTEIISVLSRAISNHENVLVCYSSLSGGMAERIILPHSFVDDGTRWHIRAFDRKRGEFRDFVLTRFHKAVLQPKRERRKKEEQIESDNQWQQVVTLLLKPHPGLQHPEVLSKDYGMDDSQTLPIQIRAALAGYLLRQWRVDCSDGQILNSNEYPLFLKNKQELSSVQSLQIAPGYSQVD